MKIDGLSLEEAREIAKSREHCEFRTCDGHTVSREAVLYAVEDIRRYSPFCLVAGLTAEEAKAALDAGAEIEDRNGMRHRPKQLSHDGRYDFRDVNDDDWMCAYGLFLDVGFEPFRIVTLPPQPEKPVESKTLTATYVWKDGKSTVRITDPNTIALTRRKPSYTASEAAALAALEPGRVFIGRDGRKLKFDRGQVCGLLAEHSCYSSFGFAFEEGNAPFIDPPEEQPKEPELWERVTEIFAEEGIEPKSKASRALVRAISLVLDAREGKKERGE